MKLDKTIKKSMKVLSRGVSKGVVTDIGKLLNKKKSQINLSDILGLFSGNESFTFAANKTLITLIEYNEKQFILEVESAKNTTRIAFKENLNEDKRWTNKKGKIVTTKET